MCVCVDGRNELEVCTTLAYPRYQLIPCYASAMHKHTHTRNLKPFEDSEPTGLKVDIAAKPIAFNGLVVVPGGDLAGSIVPPVRSLCTTDRASDSY